jgi:hypothetical protein
MSAFSPDNGLNCWFNIADPDVFSFDESYRAPAFADQNSAFQRALKGHHAGRIEAD